jgi:4-hydroxy-tetrahydrodipicolinate reductase
MKSLRVAVVGLGRMGKEVASVLSERGHESVLVSKNNPFPMGCSVGIDFTRADAVLQNLRGALSAQAHYVIGTTGWNERAEELKGLVRAAGGGVVHGANFSVGVNLFYRIVRDAARILASFPDYDPYVLEKHHRKKRDAPSGTAQLLAGILEETMPGRKASSDPLLTESAFHVAALRGGGIVGEHTVGFDSGGDEILLEHRARSRRGYALGAVLAAEWIVGRKGFYSFEEVLEDLAPREPAP